MMVVELTYILTASLDPQSQAWLDELRERHFPKERNVLKAHLTIFHRLLPAQKRLLEDIALPEKPLPVSFGSLRHLGYGVGRRHFAVSLGDGGVNDMVPKIRAHANCAECVPLFIILLALAEYQGLGRRALDRIKAK